MVARQMAPSHLSHEPSYALVHFPKTWTCGAPALRSSHTLWPGLHELWLSQRCVDFHDIKPHRWREFVEQIPHLWREFVEKKRPRLWRDVFEKKTFVEGTQGRVHPLATEAGGRRRLIGGRASYRQTPCHVGGRDESYVTGDLVWHEKAIGFGLGECLPSYCPVVRPGDACCVAGVPAGCRPWKFKNFNGGKPTRCGGG